MKDSESINLDNISSMKVVELKAELHKRGYKKTGNKMDLIERLKAVLILENARNTDGESDEEISEEEGENDSNAMDDNLNGGDIPTYDNDQSPDDECILGAVGVDYTDDQNAIVDARKVASKTHLEMPSLPSFMTFKDF
ncbi:hypothetical protein O3M35_007077 [Rhynocoris fuscipes]|uniref:SAP domain-containing protein n=1 Tax=Rhynocoris fuscipes TaxID=488301 RepID=A0AAW1DFH4_9HEMI